MADDMFHGTCDDEDDFNDSDSLSQDDLDLDSVIESVLNSTKPVSARRRIEDYMELRQLREQMNDPDFEF